MANLNAPAEARTIRFNRKPPRKFPPCGNGLHKLTLVSCGIERPFGDEEKAVYEFEVAGFPHDEHGTLSWFGNPNGSMGEYQGKKSNNLKLIEAFGHTPEEVEKEKLTADDFIGEQCQGLVVLKKSSKNGREYPRLTEVLPV